MDSYSTSGPAPLRRAPIAWKAGRYYGPENNSLLSASTLALAADRIYTTPMFVPPEASGAIDRIGCEITSGGGSGKLIRVGVYTNDPATGFPLTLVSGTDVGTIDGNTIAQRQNTIAGTLPPGAWYHLAITTDGTPTVRALAGLFPHYGQSAMNTTTPDLGLYASNTFAALPDAFPAFTAYVAAPVPRVFVRAA